VVFIVGGDEYPKKRDIIKKLEKKHKICYVCLGDTISSISRELNNNGINTKKLFFIDTLSSHYGEQKSTKRCEYISSPSAIDEISEAIIRMKKNCNLFIFDDISDLLNYHDSSSILGFTNSIKIKDPGKMIYMISKEFSEDIEKFVDDLMMFADQTKDLTEENKKEETVPAIKAPKSGGNWPYSSYSLDFPKPST